MLRVDKVSPKFKQMVDLLLFTNRMNLKLARFKSLLNKNFGANFSYLWDRFRKSTFLSWEDGSQFWAHRLNFLLSLNERAISHNIDVYLERRLFNLLKYKPNVDIRYDIEFLQYVELCKLKRIRKESLLNIRNHLLNMALNCRIDKLITVVQAFVPVVFKNFQEYIYGIHRRIIRHHRYLDLILELEKRGFELDRQPLAKLAKELLMWKKNNTVSNIFIFFQLINDPGILELLKCQYDSACSINLLKMLQVCDLRMLEAHHLRNIKNILELDANIVESFLSLYAKKLCVRGYSHKKANADRLIRLTQLFPQKITPKKVLVALSGGVGKLGDIKHFVAAFPELQKLSSFV